MPIQTTFADRFHKFQELVVLPERGADLDGYMDRFMDLFAQLPDMSAQESLAGSLRGIETAVCIHQPGAAQVDTLEHAS